MSNTERTTLTRRRALSTSLTALLAAGAASLLPASVKAQPAPAASINQAEAILLDFEAVLLQLGGRDRANLSAELERLREIAGSNAPHHVAAAWQHETGENRCMDRIDREHPEDQEG